ncbi:protein YnhH, partial [Salmonella enterica]
MTCKTQRLQNSPSRWAETQAHIPLHALSMSPILRARHHNFRNSGLAFHPCAMEAR